MKTLKKQGKYLCIVLAFTILFQGCTVYKGANVSMQKAASLPIKTKVKTVNGNLFFKYVIFENGNYYGVKKVKGKIEKTRLDEPFIESIQLKNKTLSTLITIVGPLAVIVGVSLILFNDYPLKSEGSLFDEGDSF